MKLISIGFILISLLLTACGGGGSSSTSTVSDACLDANSESFNCADMLSDTVDVAQQAVTTLKSDITLLEGDIGDYCTAQGTATLDIAKAQWKTTMASVQQLEVMQFDVIKDARNDIYNWPANDKCKVDLQVASGIDHDFTNIAQGRRGLNSVEYLLFEELPLQSCKDAYSTVNEWATDNSATVQKQARCDYAKAVTTDLVTRVTQLETQVIALDLTTKFDSKQLATNAVSDALFYIEEQTKDVKIKGSLPQSSTDTFKPEALESQFSNISKEHIKNNMIGAKNILQAGLKDYLETKGKGSIVDDMVTSADVVIANLAAIDDSVNLYTIVSAASSADVERCIQFAGDTDYTASDSNLDKVCDLQDNIKEFTDLLKNDFVTAVSFSTPASSDGDND